KVLVDDLNNCACTNGTATFADSETETLVDCNRVDELNSDCHVITGHNHLCTFRELNLAGNVKGTEIELRTVVIVERGVTSALLFLKNIDLSLELGMGCY